MKTQISFAANLYGLCEEEHAGGAIAFPAYVLGQDYHASRTFSLRKTSFAEAMCLLGDRVEQQPGGYAIDRLYRDIFYVPETYAYDYINVTAPVGTMLQLDGNGITERLRPLGAGMLGRVIIRLKAGNHRITGSRPFGLMGYGYGYAISYSYPGGLNLDTINPLP